MAEYDAEDLALFEKAARVTHEANRAWCIANGDRSQVSWDDAPHWQRESALNGVKFHKENPDAGDDSSHNNWMEEKLANGWVYGEVKSVIDKTHPCIVAFDDLPKEQQIKDALFRSIVHAIIDQPDKPLTYTSLRTA